MRPMSNVLACAAIAYLSVAPTASCGCSTPTTVGAGSANVRPASSLVVTTGPPIVSVTASSGAAGAGGCAPTPTPSVVPQGWVPFTDWSCNCPFFIPDSVSALPPPIVWEKCPAVPSGLVCEAMHVDWQSDDVPISLSPMLDHTPNGNSVLGFRRIVRANGSSQAYVLDLVADVDGPVHSAILRVDGPLPTSGCFTSADAVSGSHVIYQVYGADSVLDTKDLGAIGGDIDAIHPSVLLHFVATSPFTDGYAASSKWFARVTWPIVMYAYPWSDLSKQVFVTSSAVDPEGLTFSDLVMYEDALFFNTSTSYISGINSWNPVDGARPFVRFIGDATRGAGNLGTDGTVLVWSYGEGKKPDDPLEKFAKYDIMTAPFTTDSAALKPKRLRSDPIPRLSATPFQTACGFAAHGRPQDPFIVVRLSDGYSWSIPILGPDFHLQNPIGMSCDHLYALAQIGGRWNVARIKLSSLGTATPPD